jgi:hypothetical protein
MAKSRKRIKETTNIVPVTTTNIVPVTENGAVTPHQKVNALLDDLYHQAENGNSSADSRIRRLEKYIRFKVYLREDAKKNGR